MKRPILLCLLGLLLLFAFATAAMAQSATLTTDKPDYAPGETAIITGAGFLPGELIDLSIAIQDPETDEWVSDWDWAEGYCDDQGAFTASYLVPDRALAKSLRATAMGLTSAVVATVEFTDAPASTRNISFAATGLPTGVAFSVDYSGTNPGGNSQTGTATFTTPNASASVGFKPGTTLTYGTSHPFPASLTVGGDVYNLTGVSPASPFTVGPGGPPTPSTTVTATYELYVPPVECPENHAPTITASDLDLGQVVGCLGSGLFQFTKSGLVAADFTPVTSDPDGDPVDVDLSVTSVTLTGPGADEVEVTLTAWDDPSARNVDGCDPLAPLSATVTVKVKAHIIYNFVGFYSPLSNTKSTTVKQGATAPVKFQLFDGCGTEITNLNLPANPDWDSQLPELYVAYGQGAVPAGDPAITDSGASNDNTCYFRYATPNWIYNLQTKSTTQMTYTAGATYTIWVYLNDGTKHPVMISLK